MVIRRFYGHLGEEKNKKIERSWNFQTFLFVDYLLIENKHIVDGGGCWWLDRRNAGCLPMMNSVQPHPEKKYTILRLLSPLA